MSGEKRKCGCNPGNYILINKVTYLVKEDKGDPDWCSECDFHKAGEGCTANVHCGSSIPCRWWTRDDLKNVIFKRYDKRRRTV